MECLTSGILADPVRVVGGNLTKFGSLDAKFCRNKIMGGLASADRGFAEYMIAVDYALVRMPGNLSFEQAAPLTCAGLSISPHL